MSDLGNALDLLNLGDDTTLELCPSLYFSCNSSNVVNPLNLTNLSNESDGNTSTSGVTCPSQFLKVFCLSTAILNPCDSLNFTMPNANPDVTGIGSIYGFTVTTALVILALMLYYSIAFDPNKDPRVKRGEDQKDLEYPNIVDYVIFEVREKIGRIIRKMLRTTWVASIIKKRKAALEREEAFFQFVESINDSQVVGSAALFIGGMVRVVNGNLSSFHWKVIGLLCWLSAITNLVSLTIMRRRLFQNSTKRIIRISIALMLMCMAVVSMYPTLDPEWHGARPAHCYYSGGYIHSSFFKFVSVEGVTSIGILVYGCLLRIVRLFLKRKLDADNTVPRKAMKCLAKLVPTFIGSVLCYASWPGKVQMFLDMLIMQPVVVALVITRTIWAAYTSVASELYWAIFAGSWGISNIFLTRLEGPGGSGPLDAAKKFRDEENEWSVGQIVPLAVFLAPLVTLAECFVQYRFDTKAKEAKEAKDAKDEDEARNKEGVRVDPVMTAEEARPIGSPDLQDDEKETADYLISLRISWIDPEKRDEAVATYLGEFHKMPWFWWVIIHIFVWVSYFTLWIFSSKTKSLDSLLKVGIPWDAIVHARRPSSEDPWWTVLEVFLWGTIVMPLTLVYFVLIFYHVVANVRSLGIGVAKRRESRVLKITRKVISCLFSLALAVFSTVVYVMFSTKVFLITAGSMVAVWILLCVLSSITQKDSHLLCDSRDHDEDMMEDGVFSGTGLEKAQESDNAAHISDIGWLENESYAPGRPVNTLLARRTRSQDRGSYSGHSRFRNSSTYVFGSGSPEESTNPIFGGSSPELSPPLEARVAKQFDMV